LLASSLNVVLTLMLRINLGVNALGQAAGHNHSNIVRFLTGLGIDINVKNYCGSTALMEAADNGHIVVIDFLTRHSPGVNANDVLGIDSVDKRCTIESSGGFPVYSCAWSKRNLKKPRRRHTHLHRIKERPPSLRARSRTNREDLTTQLSR